MTTTIDGQDKALTIADQNDKTWEDYAGTANRVFCDLRRSHNVTFRNFNIIGGHTNKYCYGFRVGYSGMLSDSCGNVFFDAVNVKFLGNPSSDYNNYNRDGFSLEEGSAGLYFKNCVISNCTDGGIDSKCSFMAQGCLIRDTYRLVRLWHGITATLVDCTLELTGGAGGGNKFFWFENTTSKVIYYNCKFLLDGVEIDPKDYIEMGTGSFDSSTMFQAATQNPFKDILFFQVPGYSPPRNDIRVAGHSFGHARRP